VSDNESGSTNRSSTDGAQFELAALQEALKKYRESKQWRKLIATDLLLADLVVDRAEKARFIAEAGRTHLEQMSNQTDAVVCYRLVLELDPKNSEAIQTLKAVFERQRDWAHLVEVLRIECALLDSQALLQQRVAIAQLASKKLRDRSLCKELWRDVLTLDPMHPQALSAVRGD
jgi:tetratricopeptide (TPR) repeat protein